MYWLLPPTAPPLTTARRPSSSRRASGVSPVRTSIDYAGAGRLVGRPVDVAPVGRGQRVVDPRLEAARAPRRDVMRSQSMTSTVSRRIQVAGDGTHGRGDGDGLRVHDAAVDRVEHFRGVPVDAVAVRRSEVARCRDRTSMLCHRCCRCGPRAAHRSCCVLKMAQGGAVQVVPKPTYWFATPAKVATNSSERPRP